MKINEIMSEMSNTKTELEKASRETYVARLVVANIEHRIESLSLFGGQGMDEFLFEKLSSLAFEKRQTIERREKEIRALEAKQETLRRELDLALAEEMTVRMTSRTRSPGIRSDSAGETPEGAIPGAGKDP